MASSYSFAAEVHYSLLIGVFFAIPEKMLFAPLPCGVRADQSTPKMATSLFESIYFVSQQPHGRNETKPNV